MAAGTLLSYATQLRLGITRPTAAAPALTSPVMPAAPMLLASPVPPPPAPAANLSPSGTNQQLLPIGIGVSVVILAIVLLLVAGRHG